MTALNRGMRWLSVALLVGTVSPAAAEVLCKTGTGALFARPGPNCNGAETKLPVEFVGTTVVRFVNANVEVVSGSGSTGGTINGRGNLIIGYNANPSSQVRTGSHNLIIGDDHGYSSYGGAVFGESNIISAPAATVTGGAGNIASGDASSISGGEFNEARAEESSISGGNFNIVQGDYGWIGGGTTNTVAGTGDGGSICGGLGGRASGLYSSVLGGSGNVALGYVSVCGGGGNNLASAGYDTAIGGAGNNANGSFSTVIGGQDNTSSGFVSLVAGGDTNTASGTHSLAAGGDTNTAAGLHDVQAGSAFFSDD